jgi:uncharacterized protein YheU (UPF0270 family)
MDLPEDEIAAGPAGDPELDCAEPVEVPWEALSPDALRGVVENFVLREGTDYGDREFSHEEKVQQVMAGLKRGESRILFDPETSSITLLSQQD